MIIMLFIPLDTISQTKNNSKIKSNMKDNISIKKINFESSSIKIAANLYYPTEFKQGDKPIPAIVVARPGKDPV